LAWTHPVWSWLARISYSLYLTHQTLHYVFYEWHGVKGWWDLAILLTLSLLLADIFTRLVDARHKALARALHDSMNRFWPARSPSRQDGDAGPDRQPAGLWW